MAVLTGAAAPGHAFTLGDLRGGAVIGRSLDVSVPVLPGSGEEALATCLSAEVLFAESQQLNTSVTVTPVTSGPVPMAMVRIRSGAAVDEPVVTVVLRSNCGSSTSRRYVLLSDFPAPDLPRAEVPAAVDTTPHLPAASSQRAAAGTVVAETGPTATHTAPAKQESTPAKASSTASGSVVTPKPVVKRPASPPTPVKRPAAPEPVAAKPVLKLDPQPMLPPKVEVPVPAALPASAAASAPEVSDEAVQQALRIQALQNDVKSLQELAAKNQASLTEFQTKLRQAEDERVPMTWFYLVVGLLVASVSSLTWVLRKQQKAQQGDWWQHAQKDAAETQVIAPASTIQPSAPATDFGKLINQGVIPVTPLAPNAQAEPDQDLDIDLGGLAPSHEPISSSEPLAVVPADGFGTGHQINIESISDIRQQAEFFVSLGQTDRALNILRKQILESTEPNPLVYLDLLSLYHAQGLKADFRELRVAFNQFFNAVVPDFPAYNLEGRDLLEYPEPLAVLARFWPNIEAIAFLEACIFHNDAAPMQLSFDLAAFRDLLMLHAVAEKVTSDSPWKMTSHGGLDMSSAAAEMAELAMTMRGQFDDAKPEPLAPQAEAQDTSGDSLAALPVSVPSPSSQGLDLDLDLAAPVDTQVLPKPDKKGEGGASAAPTPFPNSFY